MEQLYEILRGYPGNAQVQLSICLADGTRVACDCERIRVKIDAEMRRRVEDLLGPGNLRLLPSARPLQRSLAPRRGDALNARRSAGQARPLRVVGASFSPLALPRSRQSFPNRNAAVRGGGDFSIRHRLAACGEGRLVYG